jgi:ribosomal protein S18 acetylase RimI-like enzyme
MEILRLNPTHVTEYRNLMLEAYTRHPDAFTSSTVERAALPLTWWESRLQEGHPVSELVFGAFQKHQLVGVTGLSFEAREKVRHKATLFGMYVPSEFRGRGLGRQLVLTALENATARGGIKVVQLTVTQGNVPAQALYERCGFVQFGLEPFAVMLGSAFVSKVHMWCDLGSLEIVGLPKS